tara:strand:+ start:427 stop:591 length:165 start_codon:yes stop_codon:yes gene_type:complete
MKSKDELSRDFVKINRLHRDLKWMVYDPEYDKQELKDAVKVLAEIKEIIRKKLE